MNCKITYNVFPQNITDFFSGLGRVWAVFFLVFFSSWGLLGQNGVTISSEEDPGPTQQNPIEITFEFDEPINEFELEDVEWSGGVLDNFYVETPEYKRIDSLDLYSYSIFQYANTIISIDVNNSDEIFVLTQGEGIKKIVNGELKDFVDSEFLTAPYDLAISNDDKIYVADNGTYQENGNPIQDRRIKVFDKNGNALFDEYLGEGRRGGGRDQFYGPIGLAFDKENNLYVADYYEGTDSGVVEPSRIKIYYNSGDFYEFFGTSTHRLNSPYRLAVDKNKTLYVADLGPGNGRVQYFDVSIPGTHIFLGELQNGNLKSPGSIEIDDYGFIYIADFGEDISLSQVINLQISEAGSVFNNIKAGIAANGEIFNIDVFDENRLYRTTIKEGIDLPVDLALDVCGSLLVNNSIFSGSSVFAAQIDIDLEFYNRLPDIFTADLTIAEECEAATISVTTGVGENTVCNDTPDEDSNNFELVWDETPPEIECFEDQYGTLDSNGQFEIPDYTEGIIEDNCTSLENLTINQSPAAGTFISVTTDITITAEDEAGNTAKVCLFQVIIQEEEPDPLEISCPADQPIDLEGSCSFEIPDYTGLATSNPGAVITQFPEEGETITKNTTVRLTATLDGESDYCDFKVILNNAAVLIITCPTDLDVDADANGNFTIPDYTDLANVQNNCGETTVTQFPLEGSVVDEDTQITLTVRDENNNDVSCNFEINLILPEPDPLEISCPAYQPIDLEGSCSFEIPDYTGLATSNPGAVITQFPQEGETITKNTTVRLTATLDGESDYCDFEVILNNAAVLTITCPADLDVDADANGNFTIPDYTDLANVQNNCGETTVTQFPLEGSVVDEDTEVILTAKDEEENDTTCSFTVTLNQQPAPTAACLNITIDLDDAGEAVITANQIYDGDAEEDEVTLSLDKETFTCEDLGDNEVILTVTGSNGASSSCTATVMLRDNTPPTVQCPISNYIIFYEGEKEVEIPDFTEIFNPLDNCTENPIITQEPQPGTMVTQDTWLRFIVEDEAGAQSGCAFWVILEDSRQLTISCPEDKTYTAEENCGTTMPDFTSEVTVNIQEARITQHPEPGFPINGSMNVTFTAVYEDQRVSCEIKFSMIDDTPPRQECLEDQTEIINAEQGFSLPNYILQVESSDNCFIARNEQVPNVGTVIYEDTEVILSAFDEAGNSTSCSFMVYVEDEDEDEDTLMISCPSDKTESPDSDCQFTLPDYTIEASVNIDGAIITQSPLAGTVISESTTITLTATSGDEVDSCTFMVSLEDNIDPVINCPVEQFENYDPSTGFALPDYRDLAPTSDNCGIDNVTQNPPQGIVVDEDTQVTLVVTDTSGNSTQCQFMVILSEEEVLEISCPEDQVENVDQNCQFEVQDYTDLADVNFDGAVISQSPEPGEIINQNTIVVLTATLNGKSDTCTFEIILGDAIALVANCVSGYEIDLGSNGTATLTAEEINFQSSDNCGIVDMAIDKTNFTPADIGEHTVTLTVTDAAGNTDTCQTIVTVTGDDTDPDDFTCRNEINLLLDETGNAVLTAEDLYTGAPGNRTFELSKFEFNCEDIGSQTVTLAYAGEIDSDGTCDIIVNVQDKYSPVVRINNITVFRNENGEAIISPQLINNGSEDNCGDITLSLNITRFTCKDIGQNEVVLTVVDEYGNSAIATAIVTVTGECDNTPTPPIGDDVEYIFIYPNPTTGPFTFATPRGVQILRVEAFDSRGRFVVAKDFPETVTRYEMDLTGVQSAVYVLKVITTEGDKIIRVIID